MVSRYKMMTGIGRESLVSRASELLRPHPFLPWIISNFDDVVSALVAEFGVRERVAKCAVHEATALYRSTLCVRREG